MPLHLLPSGPAPAANLSFGALELRPAEHRLLLAGQPVKLGARAFELLLVLARHHDRMLSKDELLALVWPGMVVEENTLQVHVSALRKLLGANLIATVVGRGYRFTAKPNDASDINGSNGLPPLTAWPDAAASLPATPNNLPQPCSHFIGRAAVLTQSAQLLQQVRLLTLTGIGGSGKTRLALQVARQQLVNFPGGVYFLDLSAQQEAAQLGLSVASSLGARTAGGQAPQQGLTTWLSNRRMLLVLDNCEHLLDAVAELVQGLLDACPELKIMATSRECLALAGEQVLAVPPLSLPELGGAADFAALQASEAVQLFVDRAHLVLAEFALTPHNAAVIGAICRSLDGIPLAVELAAARVTLLSVEQIAARLNDRFRFLTGGNHGLARHQTLRATLQWSFDNLSAAEQRLLSQLAVFSGGCSLAALMAVAELADEYATLALLSRLHDKSLVLVERGRVGAPRYRMLETVRQFALEQALGDVAGLAAFRDRHLRYFLALAEQALPLLQGPQQGEWLALLGREQENLLAAHAWSEQADAGAQAALRLVAALWRYWVATAQLARGHRLACTALAKPTPAPDRVWRCRALWGAGQMVFRIGDYEAALGCADEGLALAGDVGDAEQLASCMSLRAKALHSLGRQKQAREQYQAACALARGLSSPVLLGATLNNLAELQRGLGEFAAAEACYEEAARIARKLQFPGGSFVPLCNLARLNVAGGKLVCARLLLLESLALAADTGLTGMGEDLLEVGAGLAAALGDFGRAARFAGAAEARMSESGSQREPVDEAFVAPLLAQARSALGAAAFDVASAAGAALGYAAALVELKLWLEAHGGHDA
ncbi:ATP-binding protein [Roseateles sp.]|uniref:ATP-binding protein n=1 Tax=Roseateles sp. TaxID=1971397 RepID=UPI00286C95C0|nr:winged helix-turn-helix domain-containing protein [Roseateles sp.]